MLKKAIVVIGASRGIGEALLRQFEKEGYYTVMLSRQVRDYTPKKHIDLDIEQETSTENAINSLIEYLNVCKDLEEVSFHFLTGGGLGIESQSQDKIKMMDICWHNWIFPFWSCQVLMNNLDKERNVKLIFNFYSSSAAKNMKGHGIYGGSKMGLETSYKSLVKENGEKYYFHCFRLGIVAVKHKYFYNLIRSDNTKEAQIIGEHIHSGYIGTPEAVAKFVHGSHSHTKLTNGMICDISGGNTWKLSSLDT